MTVHIITGDCRDALKTLESESVNCVVTSPPYWGLRDYGVAGGIGLEATLTEHIAALVGVFREARRVLRSDGTLWLNYGDVYAGSWGAQSRGQSPGAQSSLSGGHIYAAPKSTHTGSVKRTPGLKPKDLLGLPWRLAFALQSDGWWLRQDIIWSKPNPMPESVTDRCTNSHEYLFLLAKSERYYFDQEAIAEPAIYSGLANQDASGFKSPESFNGKHKAGYRTSNANRIKMDDHIDRRKVGFNQRWEVKEEVSATRNKRSVWTVATAPFADAHFATFPPTLIQPCILAGCPIGGTVLDPFGGAGTTGLVADRLQRDAILIELNPDYASMARKRIHDDAPLLSK